jgi:hypothetical protein
LMKTKYSKVRTSTKLQITYPYPTLNHFKVRSFIALTLPMPHTGLRIGLLL